LTWHLNHPQLFATYSCQFPKKFIFAASKIGTN